MSCKDALIPNSIQLSPDQCVKDALLILEDNHIRVAPVIDSQGYIVGMFGLHSLMEDLLPMAAQIEDGLEDLDFIVGGAPGAAKKIRKIGPQLLRKHMDNDIEDLILYPETPLLEVIRRLTRNGSPLPVIDKKSKKFVGLVSEQSCLHRLHEILLEIEKEENNQEQE
ncbi:MAG: CBS domain-containing protein [Alphaproteobacteria bacterium]|mgnify:CR=1 FL=1|jgi:CBS-domain-containing membrane protein|nr:CBS domain-containing protein [Alphaproteobacteria bacterium]MCB1550794.1 CBS domain-containing protein [Alphaproteobacteria bacterium]MCB9984959.1 CBS domain-containing protein [Micavibrio sp.]HRK97350.1 CBS domain-containing protein [Alphaproteobacteria bacterium]